jgi:hypothetical protein
MANKQRLDLETLVVDSFATTRAPAGPRGTVRGHDADAQPQPTPPEVEACTCAASCLCPTNAYYCATVQQTAISCDYTFNASCVYDTFSNELPRESVDICEITEKCQTNASCGGFSCNICTHICMD